MNWLSDKPHDFCLLSMLQNAAKLSVEKVDFFEERLNEVLEKKNMISFVGNLD